MIESVGARVEYLPVYSPEFNPIEMMWSQLKSFSVQVQDGDHGIISEIGRSGGKPCGFTVFE